MIGVNDMCLANNRRQLTLLASVQEATEPKLNCSRHV